MKSLGFRGVKYLPRSHNAMTNQDSDTAICVSTILKPISLTTWLSTPSAGYLFNTHIHIPWDILESWDFFASSPSLAAWKVWTQPHLIFPHGVYPWSLSSLDSHLSWAWEALLSATAQSFILSLTSNPWAPPPPWWARLRLRVDTATGNGHYPQHPHVNQGRTAHTKLTPSIPGGSRILTTPKS